MSAAPSIEPASESARSIGALKTLFGVECEEVSVEGDEPLLLDDPKYAYFTQSPQHQLFCVGSKEGRATGRREHLATLASNQLLFGRTPDQNADATVFLVSGPAGSTVLRVPVKRVIDALSDEKERALAERSFDGWIELLISMLKKSPVPTRCEAIEAGATLGAVSGALRASAGLLWLPLADSPTRYGGVSVGELETGPMLWPLTPTMWIAGGSTAPMSSRSGGERVSLPSGLANDWATGAKAMTSADAIANLRSTRFVDEFYTFVLGVVATHRTTVEKRRLELDAQSREAEREFVDGSLRKLARVGDVEAVDDRDGEPLERAAARIASFLEVPSIRLELPKGSRPNLGQIQTAISLVTSVRSRKVILDGHWHTHDSGALLGFLLDDGDDVQDERVNPVALLPVGGGYELHDPRRDAAVRVDETVAHRLHPQAYQFYGSLPDRPLRPLDILRFSGRGSIRDVVFVMVIGLGLGSLATLIPLLTAQVFDRLIPGAERGLLLQLTIVLALIYIGQSLFNVARGLAIVRFETRMDARLEAGVWDRLLNLPLPFFRQYSAGDLASRAAGIGQIRQILVGTTLGAILGALFSVWSFGLLFAINGSLAAVATLLVIGAMIPAILGSYYGLKRQRTVAALDGRIDGLLLQLLTGIAKLRVTAAENRAFSVWAKLFARRRDADVAAERINVRISLIQTVYPVVCSMVLYWMLAGGDKLRVSTGMFLAFTAAFGSFLGSMLHLLDAALLSLAVIPLFERAKPILEAKAEHQGSGERVDLKGEIEVNHVSFRYHPEGALILDDVSFHVHPGEFVALVGPSGSGKSTLLRLLLGFDNCSEGGVFYDGLALSSLDVRAVRKQIGVVMQNSRVLGGDIFTNIVGNTGRTQEEAWTAARNAALDKDIEGMPMGMHTVISQGGGTLSGGQRQRLLIARALATDPRLVFFDEATSALDNLTQATVSEGLASLRLTRVVIAHRLSTIRHADRIIVLVKGKVVQSGRFDDLVSVPGPFKTLAERQMV